MCKLQLGDKNLFVKGRLRIVELAYVKESVLNRRYLEDVERIGENR